jgi:oligopeptide transport system substrate-binding protein
LSALVANRIALVAIGVAVIGSLVPCRGSESDVDRRMRLQIRHQGNGQEVQDLDPQIVNSVSSLNIISALLEGLVSEDPHDLHPVPGVAESWNA